MDLQKLLVIVGPTASGKTGLAVELAKIYGGEVVSADSMQIYCGLDIGTAKPDAAEMSGIPHHMIDVCPFSARFSVADYKDSATEVIADVASRGRLPILAGGTGQYVDAVTGFADFDEHARDTEVRDGLAAYLAANGADALHAILAKIDPECAAKLHVNDTKRVMRAIEIFRETGITKTEHDKRSRSNPPRYDACFIGIGFHDREKLYARINARVDELLARGLENEVRGLLANGFSPEHTAYQAIGYKEMAEYILGKCSFDESVENIKRETRRYAKRQLTWFRRNESINWIYRDEGGENNINYLKDEAQKVLTKANFCGTI